MKFTNMKISEIIIKDDGIHIKSAIDSDFGVIKPPPDDIVLRSLVDIVNEYLDSLEMIRNEPGLQAAYTRRDHAEQALQNYMINVGRRKR